jgi:hypothetical protein
MATTSTARIANDSPFCEAYAAMDKIIERLLAMASEGAIADEVTRLLATDGTAMLRDLMQGYVDRCAEREHRVDVVGADGIERRDVRTSSRRIETPVGEVEVKRLLYQAPGVSGIAPLDAALGLPDEKYTHELRRVVAEESAKSSFDEVVELIEKRTGGSVPKRQVEELTQRAAQDFDAFYADRLCEPEATDDLLVLSFDGKGIAMRHADRREATRKAAEAEPEAADAPDQGREAQPQTDGASCNRVLDRPLAPDQLRRAAWPARRSGYCTTAADEHAGVGEHAALRAGGDR